MSLPWIVCLAREDASALAPLRLLPGIEVAEADSCIWLRGPTLERNETLAARLAALPVQARYELLPPNQLRLLRQRVPSARLPEMRWQPLKLWLQAELSPAALPANQPAPVSLRLVRSTQESRPELLLTTRAAFREFVVQAARVRLDCLQFAADDAGRLLVHGHPLPSIPGQRFVLHSGVAVPAGFRWEPAVRVDVLSRCFGSRGDAPSPQGGGDAPVAGPLAVAGPGRGDASSPKCGGDAPVAGPLAGQGRGDASSPGSSLVLWNQDGTFTRFHGEQFLPVTRAAICATEQSLAAANEP